VEIVGLDKVVIVQVLRAAMPFVEGLLKAFPRARLGVVAARRRKEEGGVIDVDIFYSKDTRLVHCRGRCDRGGPHAGHRHDYDQSAIEEVYRAGDAGAGSSSCL
jgi:uracil phosphoribosyltransferase